MLSPRMSEQCLGLVFQALSGRVAYVQRVDSSQPATFPDTWTAVRLASPAAGSAATRSARAWEKISVAHRAGHYREGTFAFSASGQPAYFTTSLGGLPGVERHPPETDLEVFFRLFSRPRLALTVFTLLEDLRVDERARRRYPGLREAFDETSRQELAARHPVSGANPRQRLLELLVQLSLGATGELAVPATWVATGNLLAGLASVMRHPEADVHDTAVATLAAYEALDAMPTLGTDGQMRVLSVGHLAPADLVPALLETPDSPIKLEGDEVLDVEVAAVAFRDSLSARVWSYAQPSRMREAIFRMQGGQPGDGLLAGEQDDDHEHHHEHEDPRSRRTKQREPLPHEHTEPVRMPVRPADVHGPLTGEMGAGYSYPEWDDVRSSYLPDRCRVREFVPAPRTPRPEDGALRRAHGATLHHAREMLAGMQPERVRRTPGHEDGDEIDVDAAVEAMVDRRAGIEPSARLYLRQEAVERDVAFGVLVDLSASTADPLQDATDKRRPGRRRVLDVEKDSLLLLLGAMELVGDSSSAYGFSGTGPGDVRLAVIKQSHERLSDGVLHRLQSMKPIHMTRMGAAIRHVTRRLTQEQETTKYLILMSDGRPFDNDYGQQYGEETALSYAVADTHKALLEAVSAGIKPVVITVDRGGDDYLRDMCGDLEYQIIDKAEELPQALVGLYRRLASTPR